VLLTAVKIHKYNAASQIHALPDIGIAYIGQVRGFGTGSDGRIFHFHEVADLNVCANAAVGTQIGKRPYLRPVPYLALDNDGLLYAHAVSDAGITYARVLADAAILADARLPLDYRAGSDPGTLAYARARVDIGGVDVVEQNAVLGVTQIDAQPLGRLRFVFLQ
jgi:hypothetical protein